MLKRSLQVALIAAAFVAGAARASDYVEAGGTPVRTGFGECVRTGYWTTPSEECEPRPREVSYSAEVLFAFDGAELDAKGRRLLDEMVAALGRDGLEKVFVTTYADRIGDSHYNLLLSQRRLEAIRAYLAEKGVARPRLVAEARGEEAPATGDDCSCLGEESRGNQALVQCLAPDRRAEVEVRGLIRSVHASNRIEAAAGDRGGRAVVQGQ